MSNFTYNEFTTRNIGFVTESEQEKLKNASVFIAGIGGMGGAALMNLVRAGIGSIIFADFDTFEVSNLNRQLFADIDGVEKGKVEYSIEKIKKINPEIKIETYGKEWVEHIDQIMQKVHICINGCDDLFATLLLMRKGKEHNQVIIDGFAALLPNVYVVRPEDPRPEEFMNYPTVNKPLNEITEEDLKGCFEKEAEYVLVNSSSADYIDMNIASDIVSGKRARCSFAPMVIMTGCLMSYETIRFILGKKMTGLYYGYFFNPWTAKVERRANFFMRLIKTFFVRRFLSKEL